MVQRSQPRRVFFRFQVPVNYSQMKGDQIVFPAASSSNKQPAGLVRIHQYLLSSARLWWLCLDITAFLSEMARAGWEILNPEISSDWPSPGLQLRRSAWLWWLSEYGWTVTVIELVIDLGVKNWAWKNEIFLPVITASVIGVALCPSLLRYLNKRASVIELLQLPKNFKTALASSKHSGFKS